MSDVIKPEVRRAIHWTLVSTDTFALVEAENYLLRDVGEKVGGESSARGRAEALQFGVAPACVCVTFQLLLTSQFPGAGAAASVK
jgi:hypothetical protein